jgi:hypothetical protein
VAVGATVDHLMAGLPEAEADSLLESKPAMIGPDGDPGLAGSCCGSGLRWRARRGGGFGGDDTVQHTLDEGADLLFGG